MTENQTVIIEATTKQNSQSEHFFRFLLVRLTVCLSLPVTFFLGSLSIGVNSNYLMIYGFSALRVKNISAIVICLLSHQDFSGIILAVNEDYSSVQMSDRIVNTLTKCFSLSNSSVSVHKWTKLIKFPRPFFLLSRMISFPIISSSHRVEKWARQKKANRTR